MAYIRCPDEALVRHCYMIAMTVEAHVFAGRVVLQPNNHVTVTLPNPKERKKQTWDLLFRFHGAQFFTLSSTKSHW